MPQMQVEIERAETSLQRMIDAEQARQARRAVEAGIAKKRETVNALKQLLDNELQRRQRLRERLRRRPQGIRPA